MKSYHNTTNSEGLALSKYEAKARTQEQRILDWFRAYEQEATPTKILRSVFAGENVPLTSVRRAVTNLTTTGKLQKTDEQRKGPYDRPEYVWRLPVEQKGLF